MRFLDDWRPLAQDGLLGAALAVFVGVVMIGTPGVGALDLAGALAGSLALVGWRRAPLVTLAISAVCLLAVAAHVHPGPVAAYPMIVAVFAACWAGHQLVAALGGLGFLAVGLAVNLPGADGAGPRLQDITLLVGWFVAALVMAEMARHRQEFLEAAEQRAADAERTREEVALRRATEERLRIARELHDSLTHSISVIKVQAGVAVHLARRRGEEVPPALLAIQEAGGDAMRELRATLEVLRDRSDGEPGRSGLDRLEELVGRARSTGLPVSVTVSGSRRDLPPEVDRTAYRIVQEALTNVSRHSGGASATVRVDYADGMLVVGVDDDGKADPDAPPVPGTGLLGMRERVAGLGGRLRAEPRAAGGFTVRAELPLAEPS